MKTTSKTLIAAAAILLFGCKNEAERVVSSTNANVQVELLFETEGCRMYRFHDGRYHYFARCGKSLSVSSSWSENCGKNCTKHLDEEIPTEER